MEQTYLDLLPLLCCTLAYVARQRFIIACTHILGYVCVCLGYIGKIDSFFMFLQYLNHELSRGRLQHRIPVLLPSCVMKGQDREGKQLLIPFAPQRCLLINAEHVLL